MLDPSKPWLESSPTSSSTPKTIPFPDDDPSALLLILQIAHLKFSAIPRSCTYDMLLKLAILSDKYDVAGLVRPYLEGWVDGVKDTVNSPGHEGWLFISWTFGLVGTFTRVAKSLVVSMKRDERTGQARESCGALVTAQGLPLEDGVLMPVGSIERINAIREETLYAIEAVCLETIARFSPTSPPVCKNSTRHCDAAVFGSLVFGLRNYFPIMGPPAQSYINMSINDLCERLDKVIVYTFPQTYSTGPGGGGIGSGGGGFANLNKRDYAYYGAHTSCNLGEEMKRRVQRLVGEVESPVAEEQVRHMVAQREKCGVVEVLAEP